MPEGLDLINSLDDVDIEWIFSVGKESTIPPGVQLIKEGATPHSIYLLQNGTVSATNSISNEAIATIGPGEIIGEISFVDERPASASVSTLEQTDLIEISCETLREKINSDKEFASRFYLAVSRIMAQRLRNNIAKDTTASFDSSAEDTEVDEFWDKSGDALRTMKSLLQEADQSALKNAGEIPEELQNTIRSQFRNFCDGINTLIGDDCHLDLHIKEKIGSQLQREVLPYLLMTYTAERMYSKPRGYAGDFMTIEKMYENKESGTGRIGALLDRCFLDEPAAKAVQNRRGLLKNEIKNILDDNPDEPVNITSLACGPAEEVFDVFEKLNDVARLNVDLIDIDLQALSFVVDKRDSLKLQHRITPHHGNLLFLATGRQKLDLAPQHLIYSIGLIDYFSDKFVIKLMNYGYSLLKPGGRMILGNFHPKNTTKALMDHVLEWKLIHRTEEDMNHLYQQSTFNRPANSIQFEEEGVNLFATCIKDG